MGKCKESKTIFIMITGRKCGYTEKKYVLKNVVKSVQNFIVWTNSTLICASNLRWRRRSNLDDAESMKHCEEWQLNQCEIKFIGLIWGTVSRRQWQKNFGAMQSFVWWKQHRSQWYLLLWILIVSVWVVHLSPSESSSAEPEPESQKARKPVSQKSTKLEI